MTATDDQRCWCDEIGQTTLAPCPVHEPEAWEPSTPFYERETLLGSRLLDIDTGPHTIFATFTPEENTLWSRLRTGHTTPVSMRRHKTLIAVCDELGLLVRIDRKGPWGNPYKIPQHGDRAAVIERYRTYLAGTPTLLEQIPDLKGRALSCWCSPLPCHGDVLAELADRT